jgi:hypothetical protein
MAEGTGARVQNDFLNAKRVLPDEGIGKEVFIQKKVNTSFPRNRAFVSFCPKGRIYSCEEPPMFQTVPGNKVKGHLAG